MTRTWTIARTLLSPRVRKHPDLFKEEEENGYPAQGEEARQAARLECHPMLG
jgi:hypothetical protein